MDKERTERKRADNYSLLVFNFFKLSSYLLPEAIRTRHNNKRERDFVAAKTVASKNITRGRRGEGREKLDRYR